MKTRTRKWGNRLAPKTLQALAQECGPERKSVVGLIDCRGEVIEPTLGAPKCTLEELVTGITKENVHESIDTGPSVGREAWGE